SPQPGAVPSRPPSTWTTSVPPQRRRPSSTGLVLITALVTRPPDRPRHGRRRAGMSSGALALSRLRLGRLRGLLRGRLLGGLLRRGLLGRGLLGGLLRRCLVARA